MRTEKFQAKVSANDDPEKRARIKVTCPDFIGDPEAVLPDWIEPVLDWGFFLIPDVDELVEIEIVTGTDDDEVPGQSMILDPHIRWRGKRYYHESEEAPTSIHDDFTSTNYGKRRGFATPAGHILLFDDTEGGERVNLTWHAERNGEDKFAYLSMDPDGSVVIGNANGSLIYLDAKNGGISIIDENGNVMASDSSGMRMIDKHGNIVDLKDGAIQIMSRGSVVVNAKTVDLQAGEVRVGKDAVEKAVLGDKMLTIFAGHKHPTGTGPSGIPIPNDPEAFANFQSGNVKVRS